MQKDQLRTLTCGDDMKAGDKYPCLACDGVVTVHRSTQTYSDRDGHWRKDNAECDACGVDYVYIDGELSEAKRYGTQQLDFPSGTLLILKSEKFL